MTYERSLTLCLGYRTKLCQVNLARHGIPENGKASCYVHTASFSVRILGLENASGNPSIGERSNGWTLR